MSNSRPVVVVLAGWLGCNLKSLGRYEALYKNLLPRGAVIIKKVAPATAIAHSILFPDRTNSALATTTQEILDQTPADCGKFYFHAFSNGGCFLWESLRDAMTATLQQYTGDHKASHVRQTLAGVIFDSAPIVELRSFPQALAQCSWRDRSKVVQAFGDRYLNMNRDPEIQSLVQQEMERYNLRLRNDPVRVPQLYLYCENDPIAPHDFIDQLAYHRRGLGVAVTQKKWNDSQHCGHLIRHPLEYERTLQEFLGIEPSLSLRSKL